MIPTRFKRECIAELMNIGPMDETEAAKYFELGYQKAMEDWDSGIPIEDTVEPEELAENIFYRVLEGEFDESVEIGADDLILDEDFGIGVGGLTGADQGIPHGGDCKAVVAFRMNGGKPKRRIYFKKKKKKRKDNLWVNSNL